MFPSSTLPRTILRTSYLSSRLLSSSFGGGLGSPMSNTPITPKPPLPHAGMGKHGVSFGPDYNTEGGGVWQNTSSKQEKIVELKSEVREN